MNNIQNGDAKILRHEKVYNSEFIEVMYGCMNSDPDPTNIKTNF